MTASTRIADAFVADFDAECHHTQHVLAAVPEDKLDWKPHAKSMTLGQLASHVAQTPALATSLFEPEWVPGAGKWEPFRAKNRRELLEGFERFAASLREALKGRSDELMQGDFKLRKGERVVWSTKRHAAMRVMVLHHVIHHRGQLTVYLRLLDVPVPATYGPSADVSV
jgi:uncharacterized damage-inducible protein DinB